MSLHLPARCSPMCPPGGHPAACLTPPIQAMPHPPFATPGAAAAAVHVAYQDRSNGGRATVMRYNAAAATWLPLGGVAGFTSAAVYYTRHGVLCSSPAVEQHPSSVQLLLACQRPPRPAAAAAAVQPGAGQSKCAVPGLRRCQRGAACRGAALRLRHLVPGRLRPAVPRHRALHLAGPGLHRPPLGGVCKPVGGWLASKV